MSLLDADRLAKLAGLPVSDRTSLNEGGNRSYHEDADPEKVAEFRYGKNQLAERGAKTGDQGGEDYPDVSTTSKAKARRAKRRAKRGGGDTGADAGDQGGSDYKEGADWMQQMEGNQVVEIDDRMLVAEIARMRKERLQENELRSVIRTEIGSILRDLELQKRSRSPRAPSRPSMGRGITMGIPGPGFR